MTPLFWLETLAYTVYMISNMAFTLMALAAGTRRPVNFFFALFTTAGAVWAISSLLMRLGLWLQMGNPSFWLELAAIGLNLMGPALLMFTFHYVGYPTRWANRLTLLGLGIIALLAIPTFNHQLLYNPRLDEKGMATYDVSRIGAMAAMVGFTYFVWALVVFWRERHRLREFYLPMSAFMLVAGFILGGVLRPYLPYPILSLTVTISVALMGYGLVSQQLFNPLREPTTELERKVEERTRELAQAAAQMEEINKKLARRSAQLETAAQIAREAVAIQDVKQLLTTTVNLISERFGFYHAGIFLVDATGQWAVLQAASSEGGQRMLARGHRLQVGVKGIVGYVTAHSEPRIALDVGQDAVYFDNPDLPATRSEMALPLRARGEIIGALDVQSTEPEAFSPEDIAVLQTLADQVAMAISNARLFEQAQERLEAERRAYGELSRQAWQRLLQATPRLGIVRDKRGQSSPDQAWQPHAEHALSTGEPTPGQTANVVATPIKVRGQTIGIIDAHKPAAGGEWTDDELTLLQMLADQLGLALDGARLYQDTQRRAAIEKSSREITAHIRESLDIETVLKTAANELYEALELEEIAVHLTTGVETETR